MFLPPKISRNREQLFEYSPMSLGVFFHLRKRKSHMDSSRVKRGLMSYRNIFNSQKIIGRNGVHLVDGNRVQLSEYSASSFEKRKSHIESSGIKKEVEKPQKCFTIQKLIDGNGVQLSEYSTLSFEMFFQFLVEE